MDCYEKYYRRSFNALNKLIECYKNGYNLNNVMDFQGALKAEAIMNPKLMLEEQNSFLFTTLVALLGLNKESIEKTKKFDKYLKNSVSANIRKQDIPKELKERIDLFDKFKVVNTDFDNWLSILANVPSDQDNYNHLRRIRNGLLHSNFYLEDTYPELNIAHIKIKSYYESEVLGPEFAMFVFEYFSNLERTGLTEKMYNFNALKGQINSREKLLILLKRLEVIKYDYENLKKLCVDTPELLLSNAVDEDGIVDVKKFFGDLQKTKNFDNFSIETRNLSMTEVTHLFIYVDHYYGEKFYKLPNKEQLGIIASYLQSLLNPKRSVSNWIMHFGYLYQTLYNGKFNSKFFEGDEYDQNSCYPALMILKAYLIMYRMQQEEFSELDYNKIDYAFAGKMSSCNLKDENDKTDYFKESFEKEKSKDETKSDREIWNKIICDVIRNSLAHGNVEAVVDLKSFIPYIEFTDINSSKGTQRKVTFLLSAFEQFLNSEAFHPSKCYIKKDGVILTRKKGK